MQRGLSGSDLLRHFSSSSLFLPPLDALKHGSDNEDDVAEADEAAEAKAKDEKEAAEENEDRDHGVSPPTSPSRHRGESAIFERHASKCNAASYMSSAKVSKQLRHRNLLN